ncbi:AtpZ/AtpI family protein [Janibacter alittae]|uniref:AtpZ/AtpI family protein n=1 Tax=Janibacter alittae TaxID=3115209 RepID=A0ABZ2MJQ1_9MICO
MSAPASRPDAPRLVTKKPADPSTAASRYAVDPTRPNPIVQADAMGSTVLAHLLTGPALFGGLGWLLDRWLEVTVFVAVGIILGMGLSLYSIWLRYGTSQATTTDHPDGSMRAAAPHNEEIQ